MRRVRKYVLAGIGLASIAVALWSGVAGDGVGDIVAGISLVVAAVTLVFELRNQAHERAQEQPASMAEAVDDLAGAIADEWQGEATARRLGETGVIRLRWIYESALNPAAGAGPAGGQEVRFKLAEGFEAAAARLADYFAAQKPRRLVMVGEPGAGKSVMAILLTVGLSARRADGDPTPVLLTLSSWDPPSESLLSWIRHQVSDMHFAGRTEAAQKLLDQRLLIPILDGLDEIPESMRGDAVDAINEVLDRFPGVAVTCRAAEYAGVLAGGSPGLSRAPTVRILPLPATEIIEYLLPVTRPGGIDWSELAAQLGQQPAGDLAQALSTPLMASIARTVYRHGTGKPADLLTLKSRHAIENYLLDSLIDAVYAPRAADDRTGPTPAKARRWLTFLARYLNDHRDRDLAWWEVSRRLLPSWVAPMVGLAGGLLLALVTVPPMAVAVTLVGEGDTAMADAARLGGLAGLVFFVLAVLVWYSTTGVAPGRLVTSFQGTLRRLSRGFRTGVALIMVPGLPALMIGIVIARMTTTWTFSDTEVLSGILSALFVATLLCGAALAGHSWFHAEPGKAAKADPLTSLRHDRRSALGGAVVAGVVVAVCFWPVVMAIAVLGDGVGLAITGWPGNAVDGEHWAADRAAELTEAWSKNRDDGPVYLAAAVMVGVMFSGLVLLARSWTRFVVARVFLASRGQMPLRLMRFLNDARGRELLRQSGGRYQFRHIRFQERLLSKEAARRVEAEGGGERSAARRTRRIRITAVASAAVLIGVVLAVLIPVVPVDSAAVTLTGERGTLRGLAVNPEGSLLVTLDGSGTVRVWDPSGPTVLRHLPVPKGGAVGGLKFSPDQHTLLGTDANRLVVWDATSGAMLWEARVTGKSPIKGAFFGPRGRTIAVTADVVDIYDVRTGTRIADSLPDYNYRPDEEQIAVAASNNNVEVIDVHTGKVVDKVRTATRSETAWASDGSSLVIFNEWETTVWWLGPNRRSQDLHLKRSNRVAFRPDGILVTEGDGSSNCSSDEESPLIRGGKSPVRLWKMTGGEFHPIAAAVANNPLTTARGSLTMFESPGSCGWLNLFDEATGQLAATTFVGRNYFADGDSVDKAGERLALIDGESIIIRKIRTGAAVEVLRGHVGSVRKTAFTEDGRLVSIGIDNTVRLWDVGGDSR